MPAIVHEESNKRQRVVDQEVNDETHDAASNDEDDDDDDDVEVVNVVPAGTNIEQKDGESGDYKDDDDDDVEDDEVEVVGTIPGAMPKNTAHQQQQLQQQQQLPQQHHQQPPTSVFIVMTCDYPLQNDKWGEHSEHETQDTAILGVFAKRQDANRFAKEEWNEYFGFHDSDKEDSEDEDSDDDDDDALFYRQEERPSEWTARRIWVEEKPLHYNY